MPKVSVVMPVYNGEMYIRESIDSVLAQEKVDLELVIVNDGSKDRTLEIIEGYARADSRVRVITRLNSGRPSFPKNDGIAAARGEYVCFLDHDDLYDPDRTWRLVEGLDAHPDWVAAFHDLRLIESDGGPLPGTYLTDHRFLERAKPYLASDVDDWFECSRSFYVHQSLVMGSLHTQSVLIAIGRLPPDTVNFDTQFTICDDTDLWIRLGLQGKMGYLQSAQFIPAAPDQHHAQSGKFFLDTLRLHTYNYERVKEKLTSVQVDQLRSRVAVCLSSVANLYSQQFRFAEARAAYRESIGWSPSSEAVLGYLKTFIPESIVLKLRKGFGQ